MCYNKLQCHIGRVLSVLNYVFVGSIGPDVEYYV